MHICIISNSPTLRPCLPSSKKRSKHRKAHKIFISSKANVVVLLSHLKNERGYKRYLINQTSMLHNNKINKFHSISNKFTNLFQSTKNKIKNIESKF